MSAELAMQSEMRFSGFGDTTFSENRNRRLHRWTPWVAGYSSSFVTGVLNSVKRDSRALQVLDPFAGVGTTLIAAIESGDNAIGFEINPYAALACRAKVGVPNYDIDLLEVAIERFDKFGNGNLCLNVPTESIPPPAFKSRVPFFSPDIETQALSCLDFIQETIIDWVRDLFRLALGSVMVSFSNYSYEPSVPTLLKQRALQSCF